MKHKIIAAFTVASFALFSHQTVAQEFPSKPITLVVPYSAGGNVDTSARLLQKGLGDKLGQPVVVVNKPGGGGMIAGVAVSKSEPDGHTLFIGGNGPLIFGPMLRENAPYSDWKSVFDPVSSLAEATNLLLVRSSLPVTTVEEFVEYTKAHPGEVTVGFSSRLSTNHFIGMLLRQESGVDWTEVYYKGNAPAITALVGEQIDAGFQQLKSAMPHIESGKLRPLAVIGNYGRSKVLPDVPTIEEAGYPNVTGSTLNGVLAPKGTPADVLNFLSKHIQEALAVPEIEEAFTEIGSVAPGSTPEEYGQWLTDEEAKWVLVINKDEESK
ncbi:tripartite tricarboxylate transporter substrate binding protein [Hoeflea sp. CAU 1731]